MLARLAKNAESCGTEPVRTRLLSSSFPLRRGVHVSTFSFAFDAPLSNCAPGRINTDELVQLAPLVLWQSLRVGGEERR